MILLIIIIIIIALLIGGFFAFKASRKSSIYDLYSADSQPTRLRILSQHNKPIWIASSKNVPMKQNIKLNKGDYIDVPIPDRGLPSTRFWAKTGCDENGENCEIGQSDPPCPKGGCQPPIESKMEATWPNINCKGSGADCVTWYDASQVDGYTLPYTIRPLNKKCQFIDATGLQLSKCPANENLSGNEARYVKYKDVDLRLKNSKGEVIGCMSPCKKLNYPGPWGYGENEYDDPALHMCCPTSSAKVKAGTCTWKNKCATSKACSNAKDPLSVVNTKYVKYIRGLRKTNPNAQIYSYAYDDANGLQTCDAKTKFLLTFY